VVGELVLSNLGDTATTAQGFKTSLFNNIHLTQTIRRTLVTMVPELRGMLQLRTGIMVYAFCLLMGSLSILLPYDLQYMWYFITPLRSTTVAEKCRLFHLHADQAQNHPLGNQTEKITAKEIALRMMSLTRWTQVLTQMLHGVAGLLV